MRVNWMGNSATKQLKRALIANAHSVGSDLTEAILDEIDTQGPPRSTPGNPPHMDTQELFHSWSYEVGDTDAIVVARVSTTCAHAVPLEFGTHTVAARPFILPTLIAQADHLATTFCTT